MEFVFGLIFLFAVYALFLNKNTKSYMGNKNALRKDNRHIDFEPKKTEQKIDADKIKINRQFEELGITTIGDLRKVFDS